MKSQEHILLFSDNDSPGLIARLADIVFKNEGNIITSEQYSSPEGRFYLRFHYQGPDISEAVRQEFPSSRFSCQKRRRKRTALFTSGETHCLSDILWRVEQGQLPLDVMAIISNRPEAEVEAERFSLPFHLVPSQKDRQAEEAEILEYLSPNLDFAVLARYMRILSGDFLKKAKVPFINVHHSFLPAFPGINPYGQAYERGVKVIGATAHYVVEELDAGPIISQKTASVSHAHSVDALKRIGQEQERLVLVEALQAHAQDKIIITDNKTVVFS